MQILDPRQVAASIYPVTFFGKQRSAGADAYLNNPATCKLVEFFKSKGVAAIKEEDRNERWYNDWVEYQKQHGLYARMLSPAKYSRLGSSFDLLRYARFLETFAYCSPAHGYSLQVTFLGFFSILMGSNEELKKEAVASLEAGGLLAFGVSERDHGSDLLGNEFIVVDTESGLVANGKKFYIGNTDAASIISILARKANDPPDADPHSSRASRASRAPFMCIALRPQNAPGFRSLGKIRTLGVRAANVGSFEVKDHPVSRGDVIAEGRNAWDAVFGTITLGKFFLGFGSIGMCEHAFEEAVTHLQNRILYGKAVIDMPHIRYNMAQVYARLTAMKLFAYRALDYVHAASRDDRRYLLYCAVQKAKVSTEGLKVLALLQECIGAKGFESDTYFEMALRDVPLIPSLEGSMHINIGLALQFARRYFDRPDDALIQPPSLVGGEAPSHENVYLMEARTGALHSVGFRTFLDAYESLMDLPNVARFARQAEVFRQVANNAGESDTGTDTQSVMGLGQCFATIAYGQLVAENAARLEIPKEMISAIFSLLVGDLSTLALQLAAIPYFEETKRQLILRMVEAPQASTADWEFVGGFHS